MQEKEGPDALSVAAGVAPSLASRAFLLQSPAELGSPPSLLLDFPLLSPLSAAPAPKPVSPTARPTSPPLRRWLIVMSSLCLALDWPGYDSTTPLPPRAFHA